MSIDGIAGRSPPVRRNGTGAVPFTRAAAIRPFVRFLDDLGAPTDRLLERSSLTRSAFRDGEALIPLFSVYRFLARVARAEGIADLGLEVGLRTSTFDFGTFGRCLSRTITVYDYLCTGIRIIDALTSGERFWLSREPEGLRVHHWLPGTGHPGHDQADLFAVAVTMGMLRGSLGADWSASEFRLHAAHGRCSRRLDSLAADHVREGCSHTSWVVPGDALGAPMTGRLLPPRPPDVPPPELPRDFVSSLHRVAESLLSAGDCRIEYAAEAAGLSVRTLQRRLFESGATYRGMVNDVRLELGSRWLASTERSVLDIALDLGYADASNFTRAFRGRTGTSPSRYRRDCRSASPLRSTVPEPVADAP